MVSVDASDKMLKYALKARWDRRTEAAFDQWIIEEANWLTLPEDVQKPGDGFDAVICLGNSFAHLPDFKGDQSDQKLALHNIGSMVRPGGILIIDHQNYDYILETGKAPQGKNIYYKDHIPALGNPGLFQVRDVSNPSSSGSSCVSTWDVSGKPPEGCDLHQRPEPPQLRGAVALKQWIKVSGMQTPKRKEVLLFLLLNFIPIKQRMCFCSLCPARAKPRLCDPEPYG